MVTDATEPGTRDARGSWREGSAVARKETDMIQQHVMQTTEVTRATESQPIVVGHWTLISLFLLWLMLLVSAFQLGLNLS
jgi:hypothetical protein